MDLMSYLRIFLRRKGLIATTIIVALVVVFLGVLQITPSYRASATVRVLTSRDGDVDYGKLQYVDRLMNTYAGILKSGPVMAQLQEQLDITSSPDIDVEFPASTELMRIDVTDPDPVLAAEAANLLASILIAESRSSQLGREYAVSLVDPAVPSQSPDSPNTAQMLGLTAVLGLFGGLALSILLEYFDSTLYSTDHIQKATSLEIVGQIPRLDRQQRNTFLNGQSAPGEAIRWLRINTLNAVKNLSIKTLLVTSAEPGEGKSTIVVNLAYMIAKTGRTVIIVDTDLRRPVIHERFNLPNNVGLSSVLSREATLEDALQETSISGLQVLSSGPKPPDPAELLESPRMPYLLGQLSQQASLVLIDAPAFLSVADSAILALQVDGVLLAMRRTKVRQAPAQETHRQLLNLDSKIIGVVVNEAESKHSYTNS